MQHSQLLHGNWESLHSDGAGFQRQEKLFLIRSQTLRSICFLLLNGMQGRRTAKEAAPNRDCLFVKLRSCDYLELLDYPAIHEPPNVIIETARVPDRVPQLESKRRWRLLVEDIVHTD